MNTKLKHNMIHLGIVVGIVAVALGLLFFGEYTGVKETSAFYQKQIQKAPIFELADMKYGKPVRNFIDLPHGVICAEWEKNTKDNVNDKLTICEKLSIITNNNSN